MSYRDRHAKGVAYARAGRVRQLSQRGKTIEADVVGESGRYHVMVRTDAAAEACQCRANRQGRRTCSHIIAVQVLAGIVPAELPKRSVL